MEWVHEPQPGSRQPSWVTTAYQAQRAQARAAGREAHQAKRAFGDGKRAGFTPAELRPLKTKAEATAKQAKKLHDALGDGVCVVQVGAAFCVRKFRHPARAVSTHDKLEDAQAAAQKVK